MLERIRSLTEASGLSNKQLSKELGLDISAFLNKAPEDITLKEYEYVYFNLLNLNNKHRKRRVCQKDKHIKK